MEGYDNEGPQHELMEEQGVITEDSPVEVAEALRKLDEYVKADNIATLLEADDLAEIGHKVVDDLKMDEGSCSDWYDDNRKSLELASMVAKKKSFPWENASNLIVPLITRSAIMFNARTYPELMRNGTVAKGSVTTLNATPEQDAAAEAQADVINYQCLKEMPEWETDTDKLLLSYSIVGTVYRKLFWDARQGRIRSTLIMPDKCIVNNGIDSLENAQRVSHLFDLHENDLISRQRAGMYRDIELQGKTTDEEGNQQPTAIYNIVEQHRWLDLDEDGYEEPYIVTVDKESAEVLAIQARFTMEDVTLIDGKIAYIKQQSMFQDYHFIPAFDGSFLSNGFGKLLGSLNRGANSSLNNLLNAGFLSNTQGGFLSKGFRMSGGGKTIQPGEWRKTDLSPEQLQGGIMALPTKEPSAVLYQLLGTLIEFADSIVQTTNVSLDQMPANTPAASTLAVMESGQRAFAAIFRRMCKSLEREFGIMAKLNAKYHPEEGVRILFSQSGPTVSTVADPAVTSQAQRINLALGAKQAIADLGPMADQRLATKNLLEAMGVQDVDALLPEQMMPTPEAMQQLEAQVQQISQQAQMIAEQAKMLQLQLADKQARDVIELIKAQGELSLKRAQTLKTYAEAEKVATETQDAAAKGQLEGLKMEAAMYETQIKVIEGMINAGQNASAGMVESPSNPSAPAVPVGPSIG